MSVTNLGSRVMHMSFNKNKNDMSQKSIIYYILFLITSSWRNQTISLESQTNSRSLNPGLSVGGRTSPRETMTGWCSVPAPGSLAGLPGLWPQLSAGLLQLQS